MATKVNADANQPAQEKSLSSQVYKYPLDGQTSFPAMMRFTVHQVDAYSVDTTEIKEYWDESLLVRGARAFGRSFTQSEMTEADYADEENFEQDPDRIYRQAQIEAAAFAKNQQAQKDSFTKDGTTGVKTQRVKGSDIIQIYMPQSLQFNDDIAYGQPDLGIGGLTALAGLNAGRSLTSAVGNAITEGVESIFNLATGQISGEAANIAAARFSDKIPSAGLRTAAATALQTGINPGTRTLFEKPNIRQFTFTFRFISTSPEEATQVENIIRTFREEMYPEQLPLINGVPAGYRFPNLFQVELKFLGSKSKLPRMQLSYLRSCQVTYNPNSMTFHADGQPTEVDMTLVFQEYRALSKQDIQKGY